jgi:hypothetical protein
LLLRPCLAAWFLSRYACITPAQLITRKYYLFLFGRPVSSSVSPIIHVKTRRDEQFSRREVTIAFYTLAFYGLTTGIGCPPKTRWLILFQTQKSTASKQGLRVFAADSVSRRHFFFCIEDNRPLWNPEIVTQLGTLFWTSQLIFAQAYTDPQLVELICWIHALLWFLSCK